MKYLTLFFALVSLAVAQLPSTFKPAGSHGESVNPAGFQAVLGVDPAKAPGMVAGYDIWHTTRTGSLVDSWLDVSGNGRTATPDGTKSTIAGSGANEYAYLGDTYTVTGGIPVTSAGMTIVTIYKGGRIPYQYRTEFASPAIASDAGIGGIGYSGAFQFYNPGVTAGVLFEAGTWNCHVQRYGASQRSHTCNGVTWTVSANASYSTALPKLWGGFTGAFTWPFERVGVYFYNRSLSDAEIAGIHAFYGIPTPTSAFYPVTDSFGVGYTAGTTAQGYARLVEAATGMPIVGLATKQGIKTANVISDNQAGILDAIAQLVAKGITPVIYFDVGKNDISDNSVSVATVQANYTTLIGAWTAAGAQVIASTLPPRNTGFVGYSDPAVYESRRTTFNPWLRLQSGLWTRLVDIAADPRIGDVADLSGPNYTDGIHPSAAGHAIYAEDIIAAFHSLD